MILGPNREKSQEYNELRLEEQLAGEVVDLVDAAEHSGRNGIPVSKEVFEIASAIQSGTDYAENDIAYKLKKILEKFIDSISSPAMQ